MLEAPNIIMAMLQRACTWCLCPFACLLHDCWSFAQAVVSCALWAWLFGGLSLCMPQRASAILEWLVIASKH